MSEDVLNRPVTRIAAHQRDQFRQLLFDFWNYRDLFRAFLERDVKVRYRQTLLGVLWVILQPLATAGAFSLIFGKLGGISVGVLPYVLFYLAGFVPWVSFAQALSQSGMSLEQHAGLISKVYFPRMIAPWAGVAGTLPDFLIGFLVLNGAALIMGYWSFWLIAVMPLMLFIQLATAGGLGLILAALNAQFRDVRYVIPFAIQMGMLATPVLYPVERLPEWARWIQIVNPMAGVVSVYRWALGGVAPEVWMLAGNGVTALLLLLIGMLFFQSRESKLVDTL
jgi:lipopolysaccharide transport system permease protein